MIVFVSSRRKASSILLPRSICVDQHQQTRGVVEGEREEKRERKEERKRERERERGKGRGEKRDHHGDRERLYYLIRHTFTLQTDIPVTASITAPNQATKGKGVAILFETDMQRVPFSAHERF